MSNTDSSSLIERLRLMLSGDAALCKAEFARATINRAIEAISAAQPTSPHVGASFIKSIQSLTFLCRTESKRMDNETLRTLSEVEDHLVAMRASTRDTDGELVNAPTPSASVTGVCETCNGHGMIGGPSYQAPDEGGEPCPDCVTVKGAEPEHG